VRQAKVEQIYSIMQTGGKKGMQTMEQALAELVLRGILTEDVALTRSSKTEQLEGLLGRTSVEGGLAGTLRVAEG
jgi:twitching motility protein PilT